MSLNADFVGGMERLVLSTVFLGRKFSLHRECLFERQKHGSYSICHILLVIVGVDTKVKGWNI
jgi:hypothetical protein